jgi:hypothetical protein
LKFVCGGERKPDMSKECCSDCRHDALTMVVCQCTMPRIDFCMEMLRGPLFRAITPGTLFVPSLSLFLSSPFRLPVLFSTPHSAASLAPASTSRSRRSRSGSTSFCPLASSGMFAVSGMS